MPFNFGGFAVGGDVSLVLRAWGFTRTRDVHSKNRFCIQSQIKGFASTALSSERIFVPMTS